MVKTQGYKPRQTEGPLPTGDKSKHECSPTKYYVNQLKFINKTPWLKLRCSHRHTLFILLSLAKRYHSMFGYQNSGNVNILNSLTSYTNQEGQPKANSISIIKSCIICQAVFIYRYFLLDSGDISLCLLIKQHSPLWGCLYLSYHQRQNIILITYSHYQF